MAFLKAEGGRCTAAETRRTFQGLRGRIFGVTPFMTSSASDDASRVPSAASMQAEISPGAGHVETAPGGTPGAGLVCTCRRKSNGSENQHWPLCGHRAGREAAQAPRSSRCPGGGAGGRGGRSSALPRLTCSFLFCVCCPGCQCLHSELPHVHPVGIAVCLFGRLPGARVCTICLWLGYTRGEWGPNFSCANNKESKYLRST